MKWNQSIRVLCVDDNPLIAEGIRIKLEMETDSPRFQWSGHLQSADDLLARVTELLDSDAAPDVVLLDIDMPGRDAMEALEELSAAAPQVRSIVLSGYARDDFLDRAVEAGAWGYVSKNDGPDQVVAAIRRVWAGEFVFGPTVLQKVDAV